MPGILDYLTSFLNGQGQPQGAAMPQQQPQQGGFAGLLNNPTFRFGLNLADAGSKNASFGGSLNGALQATDAQGQQDIRNQYIQKQIANQDIESQLNQQKLKQQTTPGYLTTEDKLKMFNAELEAAKLKQEANKGAYYEPGQSAPQVQMPDIRDYFPTAPGQPASEAPGVPTPTSAVSPAGVQIKPEISSLADATAQETGLDPALLKSVIHAESGGNPHAVSKAGALGLMQLMPGTAKDLGVTNILDPIQNIKAGAKYLNTQLQKYGDIPTALAAYNWGPGNVDKWIKAGANPDKLPKETQNYVKKITGTQYAANDASPVQSDAPLYQLPPAPKEPASGSYVPLNDSTGTPVMKDGKQLYLNKATGQREWRSGNAFGLVNDTNSGLSGEDFLATLPKDKQNLVRQMLEGKYIPSGRAADKNDLIAAAAQVDPTFDATNYPARIAVNKSFKSGVDANNITALNTAMGHLFSLKKGFDAIGNGRSETWNSIANRADKALGDEKTQAAMATIKAKGTAAAGEMAKVFRSQGMSLQEIKDWEEQFSSDSTPAAANATLQSGIELMEGRMSALADKYNNTFGTQKTGEDFLSPEAKKSFEALKGLSNPASEREAGGNYPAAPTGWTIKVRK